MIQFLKTAAVIFLKVLMQKNLKQLTGINTHFVQDNQSSSTRGVLRGLHMQTGEHAQAKLGTCFRRQCIGCCG